MGYVWGGRAWPYGLAVVLALGALGEVAARPAPEGPGSVPLVMLVALGSTLPVGLLRVQPVAAVTLPIVVLTFGQVAGVMPPLPGLVALAVAVGYLGVRFVRAARDRAVRTHVENDELRASLLDHVARGERARIAHELHDVVAHHISMIAVQAEAARLTVPGMPPEGAKRLLGIGDTARAALTEMRRLLGVLREDGPGARSPQPGLDRLDEIVEGVRATGLRVDVEVIGEPRALPAAVDLSAFRLLQEALTNATRHADATRVGVRVGYGPDVLELDVVDDGAGGRPEPVAGGHGLVAMRERVSMLDGTITAGPGERGGWTVSVRLPTSDVPDEGRVSPR